MSIGSCLLANELEGMGKEMLEMRINGDSWADIANKFNLPNPGAARTKFTKLTGITDYKAKGQTLINMANDLSAKASKTGIFAEKQAVKKAAKVVKEVDPLDGLGVGAKSHLNAIEKAYGKDSDVYQKLLDDYQKSAAKAAAKEKFPVKTFKEVEEQAAKLDAPVNAKWKSGQQLADDTGLTPQQVGDIITKNQQGKGYLAIKNEMGVDFKQIDDVVWNSLLKKYDGDVWKAYSEKVTSQTGFDAVKDTVLKKKSLGMNNADIAKLHGIPEDIVDAIVDGKWQIPSAGAKAPYVPPKPPPPPKPPATFGEVPKGADFPYRSNEDMLKWVRGDSDLLPPQQKGAILNYTGSGYGEINGALRGTYGATNVDRTISSLDKTMRPTPENVRVVRHISGTELFGTQDIDNMVGKVIRDKGFMSTAITPSGVFTSGNVKMVIDVPKGASARYVQDISHHKGEKELLLARNTPMKVKAVERSVTENNSGGQRTKWTVYLEVIV